VSEFDWRFAEPERIHLVWAALAIIGLLVVLELRSRGALASFLSPVMQRRLTAQASGLRSSVRLGLVGMSLLAAVGALMRPQARGEVETTDAVTASADVLFVLDVSRSMLAEDAPPNRLARAKAEIGELVGKLDEARVGLIAFAGRAVPVCPLTPDHTFFNTVLSTVDTRSAGKGGSKVGEAIKAAVHAFPSGPGAKLIVLITDGDDQDPYTQDAAKLARAAGVKIVAIGLGSEEGSEITLVDPHTGAKTKLMHDGKPVISKLDGKALEAIAVTTEGVYVPAGTRAVDLKGILETHVLPIVRAAGDPSKRFVPAERFQWFVLVSLMFLLAALWVGAGTGDGRTW
jgi:Ca-activated chloride channel family protein